MTYGYYFWGKAWEKGWGLVVYFIFYLTPCPLLVARSSFTERKYLAKKALMYERLEIEIATSRCSSQ